MSKHNKDNLTTAASQKMETNVQETPSASQFFSNNSLGKREVCKCRVNKDLLVNHPIQIILSISYRHGLGTRSS